MTRRQGSVATATVEVESGDSPQVDLTTSTPWSSESALSRRVWIISGAAFLAYLALAFIFTIKAWTGPPNSWNGGSGDSFKFMNFLGWFPHAIASGQNPLFNNTVNPPHGMNMMWDTTMPLPSIVVSPITALFGPFTAYNTVTTLGLTLDAWCGYLWIRRHVRSGWAAWLSALIIGFGPYTGSRAAGHLNLTLIFAVPLLCIAFEELFLYQRWKPWKAGVLAGGCAAIQLLCTEEPLAIFAVLAGVALVVIAVQHRDKIQAQVPYALRALLWAGGAFIVLAGYPLYFQFLGPQVVHGAVQPPELWSSLVSNIFIPSNLTALQLGPLEHIAASSPTGPNSIEANLYIGIPMLIVAGFMTWRWRRDWKVRTVAVVTAAAVVFSLGPYLHGFGGGHIPLPEWFIAHLPVFRSILPTRFALVVDLGLALMLALFIDRHVRKGSHRVVAAGLAIVVGISLAPAYPLTTSTTTVPAYFTASGDVQQLPGHSNVLVVPFINSEALLWQAESNFHINLVETHTIIAGPNRTAAFEPPGPISSAYDPFETSNPLPARTESTRSAIRTELSTLSVSAIVIGPMTNHDQAVDFTTWLLGTSPALDQGVDVWRLT